MTTPVAHVAGVTLSGESRRPRTTPRPAAGFQEVLRTGAQVLLAGASAASGLLGGPLLSSAIGAARATLGAPAAAPAGSGATLLSGTASGAGAGSAGATSGASVGVGGQTTGTVSAELEAMRQLQREGQQVNLQYLQLQQEAQDENRRFSVASNLLKARHDTARSAINNLRV